MEFLFVKGGCFPMGDTFGDGDSDEQPVHTVCVNDLYVGMHEVTVGEFGKFVDETAYQSDAEKGRGCYTYTDEHEWEFEKDSTWKHPGFSQTQNSPAVCISWNDATAFAAWLSGKSGTTYRLPTEAEWEYAAKSGGKNYKYGWGNGAPSGNIADESLSRAVEEFNIWSGYDDGYAFTAPVGSFKPNDLGLCDMTGNVWEWCSDWYDKGYYAESPRDNPAGPATGSLRLRRGGSWNDYPRFLRNTNRYSLEPGVARTDDGFRLVRPAK